MILSSLLRNTFKSLAKRRSTLAALIACAAMFGCGEESKFEPRRTSRVSSSASRGDAPPTTSTELLQAPTEPESFEAKSRQCAPDAVLTAGETVAVSGPALGAPSTTHAIDTMTQSPTQSCGPTRSRMNGADRSIVTLSQLEAEAASAITSRVVTPRVVSTHEDVVAPGDQSALIKQAEEHNRRGLTFAAKGAVFSARKEFHAALRAVAAALDAAEQSQRHRTALTSGFGALTEMNDFDSHDADLAAIVAGHASQLVTSEAAAGMSPASLRERYRDAALEQLTFAAGSPTGSVALHRLGKASLVGSSNSSNEGRAKARVLLEAALRVDGNNFPAANDLAVELAHDGYYDRAVSLLRDGLARSSQPALWTNLAAIHDLRGETQLAQAARLEARSLASRGAAGVVPTHNVAWVDARTFAAASQPNTEMQNGPKTPVNAAAQPTATSFSTTDGVAAQNAPAAPSVSPRHPISTASAPRRNAMVQ